MSLINDALKRAKQAHEQRPPSGLQGAPLHTIQAPRHNSNLLLMVIVVGFLFVVLIGIGLLILIRLGTAPKQAVAASESQPGTQPHAVTSQPQTQSSFPVPKPVAANPKPAPSRSATPAAAALTKPPQAVTNIARPAGSSAIKPTLPPAAKFPEVRLQGILFQPPRPAAIINGRTLFVGDQIDNVTIIAISQTSATVAWNKQTKVLTMKH